MSEELASPTHRVKARYIDRDLLRTLHMSTQLKRSNNGFLGSFHTLSVFRHQDANEDLLVSKSTVRLRVIPPPPDPRRPPATV